MTFLQVAIFALRSVIVLMECVILIRALCEFFVRKRDSAPMKFIIRVSEPLLLPVRRMLARSFQGKNARMDISPIVVMIILYILYRLMR